MAISLAAATTVNQVSTLWFSVLFVLPQTKPTQRQDVPAKQQGPRKQMGTGLFLASPGTLFTTSFPVLCLVLLKFLQARERGWLVTQTQHVSCDFCLYF